ncbi:MAG: hypothetical protein DRJ68_01530 [Thermoprotei archaeon]|nr:MAG: hypothetical protein DRJ68_01530 [Thermoprotei archaeon]
MEAEQREMYVWTVDKRSGLKRSFIISGLRTYLMALENGEFRGRWCGVWCLPIKVADSLRLGVKLGDELLWLSDYCDKFEAHTSHAERFYCLPHGLLVKEVVFIPKLHRAACWLLTFENLRESRLKFRLIVNPVVNLMWEVRQATEPWRERRVFVAYDEGRGAVVFRHYVRPEWVAIFGGSLKPSAVSIGGLERLACGVSMPKVWENVYGDVAMAYDLEVKDREEVKFVLAGGVDSLLSLLKEYDEAISRTHELLHETEKYIEAYLTRTTNMSTGVLPLDRTFTWSKVNLQLLKHYQEGYGMGFMAGLPNFPIFFGRDTVWTLFGVNAIGDFEASREALNLLARFQAKEDGEDQAMVPYYKGEVPHEVRMDGTIIYYSIDSTPLFVIGVYDYFQWSGDHVFLEYMYDNVHKALEWCFNADRDGDGLVEHGPEGFLPDVTWMDSLFRGKSAVDVQAIFAYAFECGSKLAREVEDHDMELRARRRAEELKRLIVERYWSEDEGFFYDTIKPNGTPDASLTVNAVVPLFFKLVDHDRAWRVLSRLEGPDFMCEWGVRTRAKSDVEYDAKSYQKGSVWPLSTGWVSYAQFQYGRFKEGLKTLMRLSRAQELSSAYFAELLPGDRETSGREDIGCFIQAWSSGVYLHSAVRGLMGVRAEAPSRRASLCPYIDEFRMLNVRELRIGDSFIHALFKPSGDQEHVRVRVEGQVLELELGFTLAKVLGDCILYVDGVKHEVELNTLKGGYSRAVAKLSLGEGRTARLTFKFK